MRKKLQETTNDALSSVLPVAIIVFLMSVVISPMPVGTLMLFLFGTVLLVVGMGMFTTGVDMAMIVLGEDIGISMTKTKKIALVGLISFAMGVIITLAEPDLQVLAQLAPGIPNIILVLTVACGVGIFLLLAIFRILYQINLSILLAVCYVVVMAVSIFTPRNFIAVAFDSGGVTTGPITVPFIMAMGLGLASIRSDRESMEDSFGLVALCSVGPILTVMILGICFRPAGTNYAQPVIPDIITSRDVTLEFIRQIPHYFIEVIAAVWPIFAVLVIFELLTRRYHKRQFARLLIGFIYTFVGLVMFLTGVNVGYIPVGQSLGSGMASSSVKWILIPLGALIGYFIVAAEPAIHVLKKQVDEVSLGAIPANHVQRYLSIGVAVSVAIAMLRVLTGISIYWFVIPGYVAAITMTFFTPKIFVGIAFDSGGVASGPMTSTFLLPFAIGACHDPDRIMTDAFGLVAMVALTPILAILIMGIMSKSRITPEKIIDVEDEIIIEYNEEAPSL
ncbi:MAG: DUF1538 domain-containing protein [Clostridiales bacterium]|jgi:hypothetical protein|nr:DUF1538 domain-containing protein [Clostridiales bacterium]